MTKWSELTPDTKINFAVFVSLLIASWWLFGEIRDSRHGLVTAEVFDAKMETLNVKLDGLADQQREIKDRLTALERAK